MCVCLCVCVCMHTYMCTRVYACMCNITYRYCDKPGISNVQ